MSGTRICRLLECPRGGGRRSPFRRREWCTSGPQRTPREAFRWQPQQETRHIASKYQDTSCPIMPGKAHSNSNRSEEHTSELQSRLHLVCRLLLEKKKKHHCVAGARPALTSHIGALRGQDEIILTLAAQLVLVRYVLQPTSWCGLINAVTQLLLSTLHRLILVNTNRLFLVVLVPYD